ncbi:hypothetical protein [Kineosporia sp. NBRC 101731]|nr:hypothetical protein [Kineosporia sp. NBRC 101731]
MRAVLKVGVVGLGTMGAPMIAGIQEELVAAGFGDEDVSNLARHTRSEDA